MKFAIVFPVVLIILVVALMLARSVPRGFAPTGTVSLDDRRVEVYLAASPQERARGLSGVTELREGEGMLFVFEEAGQHGFWMKDMNFPIDIIWFDDSGRTIDFVQNFSPDSFPRVASPVQPAKSVLELPAGSVARYKVVPGTTKLGAYEPR